LVAKIANGTPTAGALALLALLVPACGGGDGKPRLVVSGASSLTETLANCSRDFPDAEVRLQFAGSDELAAQIRRGVRPDVFAAANTKLPEELNSEGLLFEPVVFATNELVLAVPSGTDRVRSLNDLSKQGTKLAIGSESVPVGSYTREVLSRLRAAQSREILGNVRSEEPDVKGVVGKLTQRAVDTGFVYASDVAATKGKLSAIHLAARLRPEVAYGAGVVKDTDRPTAARRYVRELASGPCGDALREAGFGPAP
jgi:molybdate transport system substrate-binding protein